MNKIGILLVKSFVQVGNKLKLVIFKICKYYGTVIWLKAWLLNQLDARPRGFWVACSAVAVAIFAGSTRPASKTNLSVVEACP